MNAMTTKLGVLVTESVESFDSTVDGGPAMHRPLGTPMLNDGRHHYWMMPGERYRIRHDGTGWRVRCSTWDDSHTYHLVSARTWEPTGELPTDAGKLVMDRTLGATYVLEPLDGSTWVLLLDHPESGL